VSENPREKQWHQFKWGAIGVTSCLLAYAMLAYAQLFTGAFPQLYLAVAVVVFPLTVLSWYLAFAGMPRFYRLTFTPLATWALIGIAFGVIYLFKKVASAG
jgi:hypothetical protein